ncbi:MAG: hypothetical protein K0S65_6049, partial [Labilithrix sp.]|nr:hypothetical protein [Labilithrix sp.]
MLEELGGPAPRVQRRDQVVSGPTVASTHVVGA